MDVKIGSSGSESTFTNTIVTITRQKTVSSYRMLDGSVKIQEAPLMKRLFDVTLVFPTSAEIINIETEYDKSIELNFIHKGTTYVVKFVGDLMKSTGSYEISIVLQEV